MKRKLYGNQVKPACKYCSRSLPAGEPDLVFCRRKGVMPSHGKCFRFRYDPLRRIPRQEPLLPVFSKEDFEL